MRRLMVLLAVLAGVALAAGVDGSWKATAEGPNGTIERTFTFKTEGSKLTGESVSSFTGKSTVMDGKVDGNNISFYMMVKFGDDEVKVTYKGTVSGDEIKLTADFGGQNIEWKGKRVQ
jgi:hypothetical protein